jgi:hypothetical protein
MILLADAVIRKYFRGKELVSAYQELKAIWESLEIESVCSLV